MSFKWIQLLYFLSFTEVWSICKMAQIIRGRFAKNRILISNKYLKKIFWMNENENYICNVGLLFIALGYVVALLGIPCFIISLFVSNKLAKIITLSHCAAMLILALVERFFTSGERF